MSFTDAALVAYESDHPIVVPDILSDPHPMTLLAEDYLKRSLDLPWDNRGASRAWGSDVFSIRVHESNAARALRIIDAFTKACEMRGFELRADTSAPHYSGVAVFIDGEPVPLILNERMARSPYRPTTKELARQKRGGHVRMPVYSYRPTGEFSFRIDGCYMRSFKILWKDHPRRKLETQLNEVMLTLRRIAAAKAVGRFDEQETIRRLDASNHCRAGLRARIADERKNVDQLEADVAGWQQAQTMRAYIAIVEKLPTTRRPRANWFKWARDQANRLDPLQSSPPSILDTPERSYRPLERWETPDKEIE